jgi:hypothetical protein
MQVQKFSDATINSFQTFNDLTNSWETMTGLTEFWKTRECSTILPDGVRIGRVDHFKVKSLKKLVQACVRQVIEREGRTGEHTIVIEMVDAWDHNLNVARAVPLKKTLEIKVTV